MSSELCNSFFQGQVWLVRNQRHHMFRLSFQWRNATRGAPISIPALHPLDYRTHTDAKVVGGFMPHVSNSCHGTMLWRFNTFTVADYLFRARVEYVLGPLDKDKQAD